jgi:tetratricopeptide (TPR) repeat protein
VREIDTGQLKGSQVQLTTFKNWSEVGKWYDELQRDRIIPDEKIKAKVAELIRDKTTDLEKIETLYSFVARNFRYVSLSFGQGRFQPHSAAEIFANQYGDCKDKHTLLAAMLAAAGIHAYPVLINAYRKLDSDVPSPAQFNHVITAIPTGNELIWMDTTPEVAPFRLLSKNLRKKQALYIPENAEARLETTPSDPPFASSLTIDIDAKADEKGQLTGHGHARLRDDSELDLRIRFRSTPPSQWNDLKYFVGRELGLGYSTEISEIKPSDPNATEKPFEIDYDFKRKGYGVPSGDSRILEFPLPELGLPAPATDKTGKQEETKSTQFDLPAEITFRVRLTLAASVKKLPKLPRPIALDRDYAEYHSSYRIEGNTIVGERVLHLRKRELAVNNSQDYQAFHKSVRADESQWISWDPDKADTKTEIEVEAAAESMKTDELIDGAETAIAAGKFDRAETLLKRLIKLDPKHKTAHSKLGTVFMRQEKYDAAAAALQEQTKLNPFDAGAFGELATALQMQEKYSEAESAYRKQIELAPLEATPHSSLGRMLVDTKKYKEAIAELDLAISTEDSSGGRDNLALGRAYLGLGQKEKASEAFENAVGDSESELENDVAYYMAQGNLNLDKAQEYAESAVLNAESALVSTSVRHLEDADLSEVSQLATRWSTLGWVLYKKGDVESAEKYMTAAWLIEPQSSIANHLGEISENRSMKGEAIHWYTLSCAVDHPEPEAKENLARLVAKDKIGSMIAKAKDELADMQTYKLGSQLKSEKEKVEAEFYIMFVQTASQGAKIAAVKFINGSEKLKSQESALKNLPWKISFPDDTSTKIVLNGKLTCQPGDRECSLVVSTRTSTKPDLNQAVLVSPDEFTPVRKR